MPYELQKSVSIHASVGFTVEVKGWVILGNMRQRNGNNSWPFIVDKLSSTFTFGDSGYRHRKLTVSPEVTIEGRWANSTGSKWNTRKAYFNWTNEITFDELPQQIKEFIYNIALEHTRALVVDMHSEYKTLLENQGFMAPSLVKQQEEALESGAPFMPSITLVAGASKRWENHDVSQWPVARRELGLPKPPRKKRTKKALP